MPPYDHIVVVMMENHDFGQIISNSQAPYINTLAAGGALLTNYTAITHPSEPNYFALYAGSTFGATTDGHYTEPDPTIATILQGAGKTFTGWVEQNDTSFDHNPWESFPEGTSVERDFAAFPSGSFASLSTVSFVIPNLDDDMHNGTIAQGDTWLRTHIDSYAQWAKANNSLLIITWDEGSTSPNNQVPAILYGAHVAPGTYDTAYNHYNLLSTLLGAYNLTAPNNAAGAAPIAVFATTPTQPGGGGSAVGGTGSPRTSGTGSTENTTGPTGPTSDDGIHNLSGSYTYTATTSNGTYTLSGNGQVRLGGGTNAISITGGADTIFAAAESGVTAINGGSGSVFFYAAPSSTEGVDLVGGGSGGNTVVGAANNALVYTAAPGTSDALLVAGAGNETLFGAASAGNDQFWGDFNGGNDLLVAGSGNDALIAGTGNDTLIGGTGNDAFYVINTSLLSAITNTAVTPGQDFIYNVHAGDVVALTGYDSLYGGAGSAAAAVSSALASGSNTVTLKDGTSITFSGDMHALKVASS